MTEREARADGRGLCPGGLVREVEGDEEGKPEILGVMGSFKPGGALRGV
jgi:hypothetical protein